MNAKIALALATVAVAVSGVARADEADASQYVLKFEGNRTRAEVMAATVAATRSTEPAGSRVAAPIKSSVDVKALRDQAAEAVRTGKISAGEIGNI